MPAGAKENHMTSAYRNQIRLLDSEIYYEVYGEGIPVLMIHGWSVDHRLMSGCLEPVFEKYPAPFKRVYIDLPGMGKSIPGDSILCSDQVLEVIFAFIDAVIPGQRFLLAGESYGGYLSRAIIGKRAGQVLGILMICPAVSPLSSERNVPELKVIQKDDDFLAGMNREDRLAFEFFGVVMTKESWESYNCDVYSGIKLYNREFLDHRLDGAFTYDVDPLAVPYEKPVLILTGRQDNAVGYKDQFALLDDYPRASFVILDKAGHNLQIDQSILFEALVSEWLDRVLEDI